MSTIKPAPPAPTVPGGAPSAPAVIVLSPPADAALRDATRKMLALLMKDLATAPWVTPQQHTDFIAARREVEKLLG